MTNLEALKAVIDTSSLSTGGKMEPQHDEEFVEKVIDETKLFTGSGGKDPVVDVIRTTSEQFVVDSLDIATRVIRAPIIGTAYETTTSPTFGKITGTNKFNILVYDLGIDALGRNIQGGRLADTLERLFTRAFGNDIEDLYIVGDEDSGDAFIKLNNGILDLLTTGGDQANSFDTNGSTDLLDVILPGAMDALPDKYKDTSNLTFVMSPTNASKYKRALQQRATNLGDQMILQDGVPPFEGIRIVAPSKWPNTHYWLTVNRNAVLSIEMGLRLDNEWKPRKLSWEYTLAMASDIVVKNPDASVMAYDVA
jgi:hypothetical protein